MGILTNIVKRGKNAKKPDIDVKTLNNITVFRLATIFVNDMFIIRLISHCILIYVLTQFIINSTMKTVLSGLYILLTIIYMYLLSKLEQTDEKYREKQYVYMASIALYILMVYMLQTNNKMIIYPLLMILGLKMSEFYFIKYQ